MTDNTFFEAPDDEPAQSRRSLLVLGAVGGAVVLAAGGYFLLGGWGSSDPQALSLPAARTPVVKVAAPAAKKPVVIPAVSKVRLGRDPFLALYVAPVVSAPTGNGTGASAPTSPVVPAAPGSPTSPSTSVPPAVVPAAPVPQGSKGPASAVPVKHRLSVFAITGSAAAGRARVSLDGGAPFTVHEGSVFGPGKELTVTDIGLTVGVGEHLAFTIGEDPQPEMYAHESRLVP